MHDLIARLRQYFCRHNWKLSPFANLATGRNLGARCVKCGKYLHDD